MSMVTGKYINTAIFYLLQSNYDGYHGNVVTMLPWQSYKWCILKFVQNNVTMVTIHMVYIQICAK